MEQDFCRSPFDRGSSPPVPFALPSEEPQLPPEIGLLSSRSISLTSSPPRPTPPPEIHPIYPANELEQTYFVGGCLLCPCLLGRSSCISSTSPCVVCGHCTQNHMASYPNDWGHLNRWDKSLDRIDPLCQREELVKTIVSRLNDSHAMVLRSTPMTGKTTLLHLVARHFLDMNSSWEPVYVRFYSAQLTEGTDSIAVQNYLRKFLSSSLMANHVYRTQHNKKLISSEEQYSRPKVWLIDEATESYGFPDWWEDTFKNGKPSEIFLLACVHGTAQTSFLNSGEAESQLVQFPGHQRVELMPTSPSEPCMLFNNREVEEALKHWVNKIRKSKFCVLTIEMGVMDLLMVELGGHPGIIGAILTCLGENPHIDNAIREGKWTRDIFRRVILEDKFFQISRGLYTPDLLRRVEKAVEKRSDPKLTKGLILKLLKMVVDSPNGVIPASDAERDVLHLCHCHGFLFTQAEADSDQSRYLFPSHFHKRRVARNLFSCIYREPETRNLQDVCIAIINRFGSKALAARGETQPSQFSNVPEAAYQSEFYLCAFAELGVPPMPEYQKPRKRGRVDFWLPDKEWMVELLRDGTPATIKDHQERFENGGKYDTWKIAKDFTIINFVSPGNTRRCFLESDEETPSIRDKAYHVIMKDNNTAEMRKYDGELLHRFLLTEDGRKESW